jgi:hypothetical protein
LKHTAQIEKSQEVSMPTVSPSPSSSAADSPRDSFFYIHQTLNNAIQGGQYVYAMALLSLPSVRADPLFWASPQLNVNLIASAVIHHSILVTPSSAETQVDAETGRVLDNLSPADLLILLKRTGGDGSLVSRIIHLLDAVKQKSSQKSATPVRERSWTVPLATQLPSQAAVLGAAPATTIASTPSVASTPDDCIDLAELAAVLATRRPHLLQEEHEVRAQSAASMQLTAVPMNQEALDIAIPAADIRDVGTNRKRSRSPTPADGGGAPDEAAPSVMVSIIDPLAKPGSIRISKTLEEYDDMLQPLPNRAAIAPPVRSEKRRTAFSEEEDDAIIKGIARFPAVPGRFTQIFSAYKHVWAQGRTPSHLFDHWRGALRQRAMNQGAE